MLGAKRPTCRKVAPHTQPQIVEHDIGRLSSDNSCGPAPGVTLLFRTWQGRRVPRGRTLLYFSRRCDGFCGGAGLRIACLVAAAADSAWLCAGRIAAEPVYARVARARCE